LAYAQNVAAIRAAPGAVCEWGRSIRAGVPGSHGQNLHKYILLTVESMATT